MSYPQLPNFGSQPTLLLSGPPTRECCASPAAICYDCRHPMQKTLKWQIRLACLITLLFVGRGILLSKQSAQQASDPSMPANNLAFSTSFYSLNRTTEMESQGSIAKEELARNGGFEEGGAPVPQGWFRDSSRTGKEGTVAQDQARFHTGHTSLKLQPNKRNGGDFPLAIAQVIPAGAYAGKKVEFSGYVAAEGGATPVLGMLNFVRGQPANLVTVSPQGGSSEWERQSKIYDVPDDSSVQLVITCFVRGTSGAVWFDDVSVVPLGDRGSAMPPSRGSNESQAAINNPTGALKASIEVDAATVVRQIPRTLYGTNVEWIWNANVMWLEESRQPNPEALRLAQELGISLIRYPGGHYSDFYHWGDGIGAYEKRPQALHEKGRNDRSRPNFGTDEALDFARRVNGELLITVNAGSGSAQEAADWVSYVNGKSERVRYWEIGNELYLNEGSAMSKSITVNPAGYAARFQEFARAMRAVDPGIKLGAIGGENQGRYANVSYSDWDRTVLEKAGDQIDFFAVHDAYAPVLLSGHDKDLRTVYRAMLAAPVLIKRNLETVEQQIATYAPARASKIALAITEWGPLFQFDFRGRYVDHAKTLGSALFVASTLKAFIESPKTEIANFFLLNDVSVLGWIGSRDGRVPPVPDWTPTARYFAFQLFTRHFGEQLLRSQAVSPTYDSEAVGLIDAVKDVPYLDIVSSLSSDGRKLYIIAINKHFDSAIKADIGLRSFQPASSGTAWTLTGTGIDANTGTTALQGLLHGKGTEDQQNPRFSKGGTGEVTLSSSEVTGVKNRFAYRFPPHSVTSLELTRAK